MALGWPVNENGPAPGRPIWPLSRCRLMMPDTVAVPSTDWFTPMDHRLSTARLRIQSRASNRRSVVVMPQRRATRPGVQSCRSLA